MERVSGTTGNLGATAPQIVVCVELKQETELADQHSTDVHASQCFFLQSVD